MISGEGIATDPAKVESVVTWPVPSCLRDVRAFVGRCSYYRRFVKDYAEIAAPLHTLTGKGVVFKWTSACQAAFYSLKVAMVSTPILAKPTDMYVLDTDASNHSIRTVLSQIQYGEEMVIAYGSRKHGKAEINLVSK